MSFNGLQPLWDTPGQSSLACIPQHHEPQCCCSNTACAFLADTQAAFDRLDESLKTAGRLGRALLIRHEAYVADAEQERKRMVAEVETLIMDKQRLQDKNTAIIEENRNLLEHLENANSAITESDTQIQSLTSTLHSTQQELQRLNTLAKRTESLERELDRFEQDQARLHAMLALKTEAEKAATLRRQSTERALVSLEEQVEAIERDAREERERHVEIVGRLERRRTVEQEMDTTMGRLNGSAARTGHFNKHGSGVVTHFVKDILQDNANLQMSIAELREMLENSNQQVEQLRTQISDHQVVEDNSESDIPSHRASTLGEELSRKSAQELHVHHHYHAPGDSIDGNRRHSQTVRKPKKKRHGITAGHFTPPSGYRTPKSSISSGPATPFSAATTCAYSTPSLQSRPAQSHRWSMHSTQTISTLPSSPQSTDYQAPSLFDPPYSDAGMDSSRPTTPDSEALRSPIYTSTLAKRISNDSYRYESSGTERRGSASDMEHELPNKETERYGGLIPKLVNHAYDYGIIPEENEDANSPAKSLRRARHTHMPSMTDDDLIPSVDQGLCMRPMRRAASHESLLSVSGMDIHTLQSRPGQMLTGQNTRAFSSQAVVSSTTVHAARPSMTSRTSDRSRSLLSGMAADQRQNAALPNREGFGRKVGGWMFGRWGSVAAPSTSTTNVTLDVVKGRIGSDPSPSLATLRKGSADRGSKLRQPGINQPGAIFGLKPEPVVTREPVMSKLDEEALRQSLSEL